MRIVYMISNFIYSAFALLVLIVLYIENFGTGSMPESLLTLLGKVADPMFSEHNIIGLAIIYIICIIFDVLTVILLIKNLIKKQSVLSLLLSVISVISMIVLTVLMVPTDSSISDDPTRCGLAKGFVIFNMVIVAVQFIAAVINEIKIYQDEYYTNP